MWAGQLRWGRLTHARAAGILRNPAYAGAYVFGRRRSRQVVDPDGLVRSSVTELPRDQWEVLIPGHHPGYITWEAYLANEAKLAANRTNAGARPPREGRALCQGIVFCGACGRSMQVRYQDRYPRYECSHSRADHVATPLCGSVRADTVDEAVVPALLAAVEPAQVALALAAAEEVTTRRQRSVRAAELAVERARYDADRAERAFLACEPENRLVARTLEARWETRLTGLADAEAALATQRSAQPELPSPGQLAVTIADLPALWSAPTTSDKDRKRLLRTLLADVTITPSASDPAQISVGLRWKSGASQQVHVTRRRSAIQLRCTDPAAIELARRIGPGLDNNALAGALNDAGHRTGTGQPFDGVAAGNLRSYHHIPYPGLLEDGELTPRQVAQLTGVSTGTIHYWINAGYLPARRGPAGRWCIPFPPDVEAACRERAAGSPHQHHDPDRAPRHDEELSVAEVAGRLGVKPDVIYAGPNGATCQPAAAAAAACGSASPPTSNTPAWNESPGHTSSPPKSKPKPHTTWKGKQYEEHVPTIADRVVQASLKLVLEPIFEAGFKPFVRVPPEPAGTGRDRRNPSLCLRAHQLPVGAGGGHQSLFRRKSAFSFDGPVPGEDQG